MRERRALEGESEERGVILRRLRMFKIIKKKTTVMQGVDLSEENQRLRGEVERL